MATRSPRRATRLPSVRVEDSGIHGKGLFALEAIPADTLILPIEGRPAAEDGIHVLWTEDERGEWSGLEVTNDARYVNHSVAPNAGLFDDGLWSIEAIRAGEEITHHYGVEWDDVR
jgi:SET domain-containing protein